MKQYRVSVVVSVYLCNKADDIEYSYAKQFDSTYSTAGVLGCSMKEIC